MTSSQGFWSYVHKDDAADGGRVVQLAHDIVEQYEMATTESIELFLDRDDLTWGTEWEQRIGSSLAAVAFFIPVLTPRYFASASCRNELNTFARRASDLGIEQLLLPILYMDIQGLDDDPPSDDLVALVKKFQWVDWRDLRFADRESPEYRRAVSLLAKRLVDANLAAEGKQTSETVLAEAEAVSDEAGVIELMASFETALPDMTTTMEGITEAIVEIGEVMTTATADANSSENSSFAKRLLVVRKLAGELTEPSRRISDLGDDFTRQLHDVDLGVRTIIERAPEEPENTEVFCSFFQSIRGMVISAEQGLGAMKGMTEAAAPLEKLSRDLRPPLRDMRRGLTLMVEGLDVMRPWVELVEASEIECGPAA